MQGAAMGNFSMESAEFREKFATPGVAIVGHGHYFLHSGADRGASAFDFCRLGERDGQGPIC